MRVRKDKRRAEANKKIGGRSERHFISRGGERASFCYKVPRLCPLVLKRIE
jgi:hypothetical protein